tara:strand:- start:483 stop:1316 length:834 start_codon:yes stop_codon:yes gene_type:complete
MPTTVFDPSEGPSDEQKAAEASALEQGEKIAQMEQEDRERKFQQQDLENENPDLIAGKFKSQDELLKAYEELQKKMSSGETEEESTEEAAEPEKEAEAEEQVSEAESAISRASAAYEKEGKLTEESIAELSKLDSKELIEAYVSSYSKNQSKVQAQAVDESAQKAILDSVGGESAYKEMVSWAGSNLSADEISSYNEVTTSGNTAAIKFAVEALSNRYKNAEGYEAPLVTGRRSAPTKDTFRSHAELARAIADPRYNDDPAFRQDVEQKLSRSTDLL